MCTGRAVAPASAVGERGLEISCPIAAENRAKREAPLLAAGTAVGTLGRQAPPAAACIGEQGPCGRLAEAQVGECTSAARWGGRLLVHVHSPAALNSAIEGQPCH